MQYNKIDLKQPPAAASATGIMQCLRMLAEEAASLQLTQTLEALEDALEICRIEGKGGQPGSAH